MWQDYIIAIGALVFNLALIPSIRSAQKPAILTSAPTAVVLYVFAGTFVSLHLWYSAAMQLVGGSLWAVLAIQRFLQSRTK